MRFALVVLAICLAWTGPGALASAETPAGFDWPQDAALTDATGGDARAASQAQDQARRAAARADEARFFAHRSDTERRAFHSALMRRASLTAGSAIGQVSFDCGSVFTGRIESAGLGILVAGPDGTLERFEGAVLRVRTDTPFPYSGRFVFRNGDVFVGDIRSGLGVYTDAGQSRRFVGRIDFSAAPFRPITGRVETRAPLLLADSRS